MLPFARPHVMWECRDGSYDAQLDETWQSSDYILQRVAIARTEVLQIYDVSVANLRRPIHTCRAAVHDSTVIAT